MSNVRALVLCLTSDKRVARTRLNGGNLSRNKNECGVKRENNTVTKVIKGDSNPDAYYVLYVRS